MVALTTHHKDFLRRSNTLFIGTIHTKINWRLSTAVTTGIVHVGKNKSTVVARERERESVCACVCVRERDIDTHTRTDNQPAFTMDSMVDGVLLLLFGEILRNNVVQYCCTNEDGMAGGVGELNKKNQIFTYYEAGWPVLMIWAGSYQFGVLMIFLYVC
jgi:hypothetical protein